MTQNEETIETPEALMSKYVKILDILERRVSNLTNDIEQLEKKVDRMCNEQNPLESQKAYKIAGLDE